MADAKAKRRSLRAYQRDFGVMFLPADREVGAHEILADLSGNDGGALDHCGACHRKRLVARWTVQ